jgi:hypothetical protein
MRRMPRTQASRSLTHFTIGLAFVAALALAYQGYGKADPALDASAKRLMADVSWLADDARLGRRAGTTAALESGEWIAAQLRALQLEPAGEGGTYFQEFQVPLEPRSDGRSFFELTGTPRSLEKTGALVPLFCAEGGDVSGRAVYAGYGIDASEKGWNDYDKLDVTGAIVFVVRGAPIEAGAAPVEGASGASPHGGASPASPHGGASAASPHGGASAASPHGDTGVVAGGSRFANESLIFTKVMTAKRKGAIAVVVLQNPLAADEPLLRFGEGGSARANLPCAMLSLEETKRLFPSFAAGFQSDPKQIQPSLAASARLFTDVHREKGPARNVLARLKGTDRGHTVVVGAHYDHLGHGGTGSLAPQDPGAIHNGADDNASGVAVVIEMARQLSTATEPPACDVVFALWSGEELGLLGSEHWAEKPTFPLATVKANLNLDMVGRAGNGKLQVLAAGTAAPFAEWMPLLGRVSGLDLQVNASGNALAGSSDHATFLKRKIPALHLFSGLHTEYHKPTDDIERFEALGAAHVALLGVEIVRKLAGADELAFVESKAPSGDKRIQSGFNAYFGSIPNYAWEKGGVLIDGTSPGSPAERAGFLKGDLLLVMGDVKLESIYDFTYALQLYKPGDVVLVKFRRDNSEQESRVTLGTRGAH